MTEPLLAVKEDIAKISGEVDNLTNTVATLAGVTFENQQELVKAFNMLSDQLTNLKERVAEIDGKPIDAGQSRSTAGGRNDRGAVRDDFRRRANSHGSDFRDFWRNVVRHLGY